MNIALKKLALLERTMVEKEENARIQGFTTNVIDVELKKRVTDLLDKVRRI